ncbi:MAG: thioredoxin family protein [Comamonadaceae bacterium]|nr:thioredoxin family protein [Burkholderiales bacterium]MEB2348049.1 thioredoxin family protein [Comamonadaceae bacterium]
MPYSATYLTQAPAREAMDQSRGAVLLEFGTPWCGHCARAAPLVRAALASYPELPHVKVQDGPGQRLGRSFGVKLWPTLVFLRDGAEVARLVRPQTEGAIADALAQISAHTD